MRLQPSRAREHLGAPPASAPAVLYLGSSGFHASLAPGYIILRYLFVVVMCLLGTSLAVDWGWSLLEACLRRLQVLVWGSGINDASPRCVSDRALSGASASRQHGLGMPKRGRCRYPSSPGAFLLPWGPSCVLRSRKRRNPSTSTTSSLASHFLLFSAATALCLIASVLCQNALIFLSLRLARRVVPQGFKFVYAAVPCF